MMYDLARVERQRRATQKESPAGTRSSMRMCTGECRLKRSIAQFKGGSNVCIRCARRTA